MVVNRMSVKVWTLKAVLMRSQTEACYQELEENGFCYKVAKALAELCSCPSILWKVELVSNSVGCLRTVLSKVSEEQPGCSRLLPAKYKEREMT